MNLSNLPLRWRLGLGFGLLTAMLVGVATLSLGALGRADAAFGDFVHGIGTRTALAARLRAAVDTRAISARNLVLVGTPAEMDAEKAHVQQAHGEVRDVLDRLKEAAKRPGVSDRARALIADIDKTEQDYGPVELATVAAAVDGRKDEAITAMNARCRPLLARLVKATDDYAAFSASVAARSVEDSYAQYALQRNLIVCAGLASVMLAVFVGWAVTRSVLRPVGEALAIARAVAGGDLTMRVRTTGKDEMSRLLDALGAMSTGLATIVRQVRDSSERIATGSAEIATGNLDLSQRTEEQAGALQQTAATMEQLTTTFEHNAGSARQADALAAGAREIAQRGGGVVGGAVETMRAINQSSKKIAEIIGVIDGIAFQTNILALNAAVEAARAGEQGRGFAVVAGEVRGLAKRSADAAREIKGLIQASVEQVERGSQQVDAAGASMAEIVDAFERVGGLVAEISTASRQQSAGAAQVGEAVSQMDRVTQQNAALVEESAAASESLRSQSEALRQVVATFRLTDA